MAKYKFIIDESGNFNNKEKYIIIGGVLFNINDQEELEKYFFPIHNNYCSILNKNELKGSELGKLSLPIISHIGHKKEIMPVVFIIDKEESFIFNKYDKLCFKYSKAIEWMVKKLDDNDIINLDVDELYIRIDNINLSDSDKINFYNWLPKNLICIKEIKEGDSKDFIALQLADVVVNSFSKNKVYDKGTIKNKLLNPIILFFLEETEKHYIK